jgi:hypothetical protein
LLNQGFVRILSTIPPSWHERQRLANGRGANRWELSDHWYDHGLRTQG